MLLFNRRLFLFALCMFLAFTHSGKCIFDPTSEAALKKEEKFFKKVEKKLCKGEKKEKDPLSYSSLQENQPNSHKPLILNKQKDQHNKHEKKSLKLVQTKGKNPKKQKVVFSGFYGGLGGSINHLYVDAELSGIAHKPIMPITNQKNMLKESEIKSIFYGSYSYNKDMWLISGQAFLGYDIPIAKIMRLGLEIQGAIGWRDKEITSNGVYGNRTENFKGPKIFSFEGKSTDEVDFSYLRQTIHTPYCISILPRIGIALSKGAFLYTKVGLKYENYEVTDHPETIDVKTQHDPKTSADIIFNENKASFMGGIGLEALVTKQMFFRMECLCSGGPNFLLEAKEIKNPSEKSENRQLEQLQVKSMRNFSFGFGAGIRF